MSTRKPVTINVKPHKVTITDKPKPADNQSADTTDTLFVIGIFLVILFLIEQLGGK